MFPVLFEIPLGGSSRFPIRMFGIMVILGFLAGTWVIARRLEKQKILSRQDTFDFCFYMLALGILGARLLYVMQEFDQFKGRFLRIFQIWEGGLVWYGGFALSVCFAFWWTWKKKLPVLKVTDACALGLALSLAIGRWGCFCAGDDYGEMITDDNGEPITDESQAPWYAVQFPSRSDFPDPEAGWRYEYSETPTQFRSPYWLHPVQIYMSLSNLAVFGALTFVSRVTSKPGAVAACYFLFYAVARFVVEFWRGDVDRGVDVFGTGLSFSQFAGIPIFLVGVAL